MPRKERWPGEQVFLDAIDQALQNYARAYLEAAPEYFPDAESEWPEYEGTPMVVGWIVGVQTLGTNTEQDDVDAFIPVVSEGMSTFTATGMADNMHTFFRDS